MQRFFAVGQDTSGNAIPSVTVTVNLTGTATLATLFSDNAFTPLANPFTSNTDGTYQFYARNGRYDVVLTKTNYTFTASETTDVLLDDDFSVVSPAQITANQNDYAPTNGTNVAVWRLTSDAARTITGIVAPTSNAGVRRLSILNSGSFALTLSHNSGSSTAGNRFTFPRSRDVILLPNENLDLYYDATLTSWVAARVPNRRILSVTTADSAALTNSVVETTMFTATVSGGVLGSSNLVTATAYGKVSNTSGVGTAMSLRHKYGGTTLGTLNFATNFNFADLGLVARFIVAGDGATNAQYGALATDQGFLITSFNNASGRGTSAVDSTIDQTLLFTAQWGAASNLLSYTVEYVVLEIVP